MKKDKTKEKNDTPVPAPPQGVADWRPVPANSELKLVCKQSVSVPVEVRNDDFQCQESMERMLRYFKEKIGTVSLATSLLQWELGGHIHNALGGNRTYGACVIGDFVNGLNLSRTTLYDYRRLYIMFDRDCVIGLGERGVYTTEMIRLTYLDEKHVYPLVNDVREGTVSYPEFKRRINDLWKERTCGCQLITSEIPKIEDPEAARKSGAEVVDTPPDRCPSKHARPVNNLPEDPSAAEIAKAAGRLRDALTAVVPDRVAMFKNNLEKYDNIADRGVQKAIREEGEALFGILEQRATEMLDCAKRLRQVMALK